MRTRLTLALLSTCLWKAPAAAEPLSTAQIALRASLEEFHKARPIAEPELTAGYDRLFTLLGPNKAARLKSAGSAVYVIQGVDAKGEPCSLSIRFMPNDSSRVSAAHPTEIAATMHGKTGLLTGALSIIPPTNDYPLDHAVNSHYLHVEISQNRISVVDVSDLGTVSHRTLNFFSSGGIKSFEQRVLANGRQLRAARCIFNENTRAY